MTISDLTTNSQGVAVAGKPLHAHRFCGGGKKKKLADTRTEAEEARWFEQNQDQLLRLFEQAAKEGGLPVGGKSVGITLSKDTEALRRPPSQKVMLRIPTEDLDRARRQAAGKGIGYQTYIKMLLREGLDRQEGVRSRA